MTATRWLAISVGLATGVLAACASTKHIDELAAASRRNAADFIVVAVANNPLPGHERPGSTGGRYGSGPYRVSDYARRALHALALQYQLQAVDAWPIVALHAQCAVFALPSGASAAAVLKRLQADQRVSFAEPLQEFQVRSDAPDSYTRLQYSNERMEIGHAQRLSRGHGVRVAVIDTGLATDHPDLRGRIELQRNFVDDDAPRFLRDRHGTAVAGIIAANASTALGISGIAPEARILALKACWQLQEGRDDARCNSFTLAKALAGALEFKANIINLSLTGPPDPLLSALVQQAMRRGIIIVGARGVGPSFPGSIDEVLGVSASEEPSVAPEVLQAPGLEVLTLAPGGHYDFSSGSSISTAEITGVTALLLARDPGLSAQKLHRLLSDAMDTVATPAGVARSVNACQALAQLTGTHDCGSESVKN